MSITAIGILVVIFGLLIASFYKPIFGVLGYLTIYVIYNPDIWWGIYLQQYLPRPSFVAVIILLLSSLLHLSKLNWQITRREIELYLFLAIIWLVSVFFGVGIEEGNWIYLEKMTKLFVFIFLFIRVVASVGHYKYVVWTLVLCACFLAFQAHTVSYGRFAGGRLDSLGGIDFRESNGFAAFMAMVITLLGTRMLTISWWGKPFVLGGIVLVLNALIMTQSRAVFFAILLATPFAFLYAPKERRKYIHICIVLGIILFLILANVKFFERMKTIETEVKSSISDAQDKMLTRVDFWRASLDIFSDHPLGIGIKNFEKVVPHYDRRNIGMDAHNTYVLCYSEIGILGITLFIIIIVEGWLQLIRIRRMAMNTQYEKDINLHVYALRIIFIIYLFGYMMTHSVLYTELLWILLSMPICLENATKKLLDAKTSPANIRTSKHSFLLWKRATIQSTESKSP